MPKGQQCPSYMTTSLQLPLCIHYMGNWDGKGWRPGSYSLLNTLLDPSTLRGVVGKVKSLDKNLTLLELGNRSLNKLEGLVIGEIDWRLIQHPLSRSSDGHYD